MRVRYIVAKKEKQARVYLAGWVSTMMLLPKRSSHSFHGNGKRKKRIINVYLRTFLK